MFISIECQNISSKGRKSTRSVGTPKKNKDSSFLTEPWKGLTSGHISGPLQRTPAQEVFCFIKDFLLLHNISGIVSASALQGFLIIKVVSNSRPFVSSLSSPLIHCFQLRLLGQANEANPVPNLQETTGAHSLPQNQFSTPNLDNSFDFERKAIVLHLKMLFL